MSHQPFEIFQLFAVDPTAETMRGPDLLSRAPQERAGEPDTTVERTHAKIKSNFQRVKVATWGDYAN